MKKVLVLTLAFVLVAAMSVGLTLAYLQDSAIVENTFTYGQVGIDLTERDVDNDTNSEDNVTVDNVVRDRANKYELIPGSTYVKDPTIYVDDKSENCWLFVRVENGLERAEAGTTIVDQLATNGWALVDGETNVYWHAIAAANAVVPVFGTFTIASNADVSAYGNATIKVTAYAVQAENFGTAKAAWDATFGN